MAKKLQLLRNGVIFDTKALALTGLDTQLKTLAVGEPAIASYTDGDNVGILLGISYGDGKNYQIFEGAKIGEGGNLEIPQEVQDAIKEAVDSIIGGASTEYNTLKKIEDIVKTLQSELDVTQVGAGLETNGSYKANGSTNYIKDAASLKDADEKLDAALKAEEDARKNLEATVTKNKVIAGDGITVNTNGANTVVSAKVKADNNALKVDTENGLYVDESALEKYQGTNAIAVSEAQGGIKTISLTIDPSDKVLSQSATGLKTSIQIVKLDTPSGDTVQEEFKLVGSDGTTALGETIKIYKDKSLQDAELTQDDNGYDVLRLTYNLANGTTKVVDINVDDFLRESEFKNGLQVLNGEVSVKIAEGSEGFLTVDENGIKLSGVQAAIDSAKGVEQAAIDKIEASVGLSTDGDHIKTSGNYTSEATTIAGEIDALDKQVKTNTDAIATTNAHTVNGYAISTDPTLNGGDITLTGYDKGSESTDITASDTINAAFGKVENKISTLDGNVLKQVEAGSGITVTEKAANKQTISISENAVWDCGVY